MIILASKSPRRSELLALAKIDFIVKVSNQPEEVLDNLSPEQIAKHIALTKAKAVIGDTPNDIIIGADTIVVVDDVILGKPRDKQEAFSMLKRLSGKTHQVITGVAIINGVKIESFTEVTDVTFYPMTDSEIVDYIESEEVFDKAGSYAIQGLACKYIKEIKGDYYNVMGLPVARLYQYLKTTAS